MVASVVLAHAAKSQPHPAADLVAASRRAPRRPTVAGIVREIAKHERTIDRLLDLDRDDEQFGLQDRIQALWRQMAATGSRNMGDLALKLRTAADLLEDEFYDEAGEIVASALLDVATLGTKQDA